MSREELSLIPFFSAPPHPPSTTMGAEALENENNIWRTSRLHFVTEAVRAPSNHSREITICTYLSRMLVTFPPVPLSLFLT